jgi:pyruvate dehydrogenase kinase 2/3/4
MATSAIRGVLRAGAAAMIPPGSLRAAAGANALAAAAPTTTGGARLQELVGCYTRESPTPVTVRDLLAIGARQDPDAARLASARWLHAELPVRLAHRMAELGELPYGLARMPSVVQVHDMYARSFLDIVDAPRPDSCAEADRFTDALGNIRDRHEDVVKLIAKGVLELKQHCGRCPRDMEIRSFLDRFYMSRIAIRVLLSHHLALGKSPPGHAGIFDPQCSPAAVVESAAEAARSLAYAHYGEAPEVQILGNTDVRFPYIEKHVYHCVFELLKNSLRATVEKHRDAARLPPVRVIIAGGKVDVTIKISDEGGGFRRSEMERVWTYLFTTAKIPAQQLLDDEYSGRSSHTNRPDPIAGFGYGLPLSRLYARYFGGELSLSSMEGYGTDAYLHLSFMGDREECLL